MRSFEIIILAGYSCAGKTTLGKAFSEFVNIDRVHQQSIYRDIASAKGYDQARDWLADVGPDVFIQETIDGVIKCIGELNPNRAVLIDEAYNLRGVQKIKEALPSSRVTIVAIDVDQEIRSARMVERISGNINNPKNIPFK